MLVLQHGSLPLLLWYLHSNKFLVKQQGKPCPFSMLEMPCRLGEKNPVCCQQGNLCCMQKEIFVPSTVISSANIYMHMILSSQQGFYRPLPEVHPVDVHPGYPCWCWPRFSYGTNSLRITLLDRQNFIRVWLLSLLGLSLIQTHLISFSKSLWDYKVGWNFKQETLHDCLASHNLVPQIFFTSFASRSAAEVIELVLSFYLLICLSVCHSIMWCHQMMSVGQRDSGIHKAGGVSAQADFHFIYFFPYFKQTIKRNVMSSMTHNQRTNSFTRGYCPLNTNGITFTYVSQ